MNKLLPGTKCVVYSMSSNDTIVKTSGTFCGYVMLGEDTAICIEMNEKHGDMKGKIRLIPMGAVASIDVIEAPDEEESKEKEEEHFYYS